uniref:Zygote arrest 1 n=1 Tax=Aotus nancymaae TaxID=37293 RepID=A0A2K5EPX9_AOTNA
IGAPMAALGDEVLDGYVFPACAPCSYPYPNPAATKGRGAAGGSWQHRGGGCLPASSSFYPFSAGCSCRSWPSWRRWGLASGARASTPRCSARWGGARCSAGPATPVPAGPGAEGTTGGGSPPQRRPAGPGAGQPTERRPRPVRFPRTVAVYSPVASRRVTAFLRGPGPRATAGEQRSGASDGEQGSPPVRLRAPEEGEASASKVPRRPQSEDDEDDGEAQAAVRASWELPADGPGLPPREAQEGEEARRSALRSPGQSPPAGRARDGGDGREAAAAGERQSLRSPEPREERLRFQFLEQKYGYYHCKDCNIRWESAYVWCVQGTNKVYFKQFCRSCQKSYNPYRVEDIACKSCKQTKCSCPVKLRHVDPKRPHRQDLCGRCKGKRLSCDSTFSFKYII